jgi:hypothetical protein
MTAVISGINDSLLIETYENESELEFRHYMSGMLTAIYGTIPDWLEYRIGRQFKHNNELFREFICSAGSVSAFIQQHAIKQGGISRGLIVRGTKNGSQYCCEIRDGKSTEFDFAELSALSR